MLIAGYPPIRFAHSREKQVLRKSKRYAQFLFFFLPKFQHQPPQTYWNSNPSTGREVQSCYNSILFSPILPIILPPRGNHLVCFSQTNSLLTQALQPSPPVQAILYSLLSNPSLTSPTIPRPVLSYGRS